MSVPQIDMNRLAVYDLETIRNIFTATFYSLVTKKIRTFVLFDDFSVLIEFYNFLLVLRSKNYSLIGFNNINFDAQILEYIITNYDLWVQDNLSIQQIVENIYNFSQKIIFMPEEERWQKLIPEFKMNIPQIDIFKQKHYDGKAKQGTSLKFLEFSIRFENVQEMPISHDTFVTKDQIQEILDYNINDVKATATFFELIKFETELRIKLSEKYNINLINASEPRIAKSIFAKFLCDEMEVTPKQLREMKTFRQQIDLEEIIFSYIKFQTNELNNVLHLFKNAIIFPNGGSNGKDSDYYIFKDSSLRLQKNKKKGKLQDLSKFEHFFEFANIPTDLGLGGIHACCESGIYEAKGLGKIIDLKIAENLEDNNEIEKTKEDWIIYDIDVTSFYPNLAIKNNVKPEHLGESFSKIYEQIFIERSKISKTDPINYVYKIILNSTYGLSKEINSYLYDPKFTYSITINGQLSILMLVEMLWLTIPGIKIYQENTDGVTIGFNPKYLKQINNICQNWCETTKLQLEYAYYKKMIIVDVNNYIAVYTSKKCKQCSKEQNKEILYNGSLDICPIHNTPLNLKVKKKGLFETELDYHKNASMLIVPKALEAFYVNDVDYKKFIIEHNDFYDFLIAVKKKRDFELNLKRIENCENGWDFTYESQQKVTRFFASTKGGRLVKQYKDGKLKGRTTIVLKDSLVTIANKLDSEKIQDHMKNINYKFYIKETEKIIDQINPPSKNQMTLF